MKYDFNNKIKIVGSLREVLRTKEVLNSIDEDILKSESKARLEIQKMIGVNGIKANIMYDGNYIWNYNRIIRNVKQIKKEGILGYARYIKITEGLRVPEYDNNKKPVLSDYFYQFLSLSCGSIAHTNRAGWIAKYSTSNDLKKFFQRNEFKQRVYDYIPEWKTDAKTIVKEIEAILK